ncbi:MAG: hypothetical protein PUG48_03690 [Clostridia bacterium]|nr:hypothetical protein [Clostridia bacterium]
MSKYANPHNLWAILLFLSVSLMLIFGLMGLQNMIKYKDYVDVEAVVVKSGNDTETVNYIYNEKVYTAVLQLWGLGEHYYKEKIFIKCNPDNPEETNGSDYPAHKHIYVAGLFLVLSLVFAVLLAREGTVTKEIM